MSYSGQIKPWRNRLLRSFGLEDEQLRAQPERVSVQRGEVLLEPDGELRHVWFPEDCVVSLIVTMHEGGSSEAGTIGREGAVGMIAALGGHRIQSRAVVPIPGDAVRVPAEVLRAVFEASPRVRRLCLCYADALLTQVLQLSACSALHPVEARLCRSLLQLEDRTSSARPLPLTHDFLAEMLGVHRSTVTQAAHALQKAGAIAYRRGQMTIVDRARLERASCECYATVNQHYQRLLPRED